MILYNVTINIDKDVQVDWVQWMKESHIPEVLKTGYFTGHKMLRLLNEEGNDTGATYAIQYYCHSLQQLVAYLNGPAPALREKHTKKFEGKFVAFRTFLEEVE